MVKKSLKQSLWIGAGTTIGSCLLPRLFLFPELYNETYPPIWLHALMIFATGSAVSFLILMMIGFIGCRVKKKNQKFP